MMAFTRRDYVALGDAFKRMFDADYTDEERKIITATFEAVCEEVAKVNGNFNRERLLKQIFGKPTHKVDPANRAPSPLLMASKKPTTP